MTVHLNLLPSRWGPVGRLQPMVSHLVISCPFGCRNRHSAVGNTTSTPCCKGNLAKMCLPPHPGQASICVRPSLLSQQLPPLYSYSSLRTLSIICIRPPNIVLDQTNSTPYCFCSFKWLWIFSKFIGHRFHVSFYLPNLSSSLPFNPPLQIHLSSVQLWSDLKSQPRIEFNFEPRFIP